MHIFSKLLFLPLFVFLFSNVLAANSFSGIVSNPNAQDAENFRTQDDYSLSGRVTDPNGEPVAGARVTAQGKFGGAEIQIITDASGAFRFEKLTAGDYKIKVEANGFSIVLREVSLKNNVAGNLEIALPVGSIAEEVTVTATRTQISTEETAVPVSVVGREEIERKAINTVGDVFRTLPGTSTVNEGAFQVRPRIRGLDSNRVLILIDGERLNNSRTSTGQSGIESGLVDTSQIETLEVVRGSGSVLYGTDALAGTINIITRDTPARRENGFRFGGTLDTFYSSNENGRRGNLAVNGSNKFFAFRVAQSLERFDNYKAGDVEGAVIDPLIAPGITADGEVLNSQSHGSNTQATTRFFINDTNTLRLNYERRRAANIGSPGLVGNFNAFFPFSNRDKFSARYDTVNLTEQLARVSVSGYYQTQYRNFSNIITVSPAPPFFPGVYQFNETVTDTKTSGFDVQTDWTLGSRNNLTAGASFFRDTNTDRRLTVNSSTSFSPIQSINRSRSVPDANLTNYAFFAQNDFRLFNRLRLTGGFRVDKFQTNAEPTTGFGLPTGFTPSQLEDLNLAGLTSGLNVSATAVTGDFGVVFNATENLILSARIGRSFRVPNLFERFFTETGSVGGFVVGNPNLEPESGINFDTSVKLRTSRFTSSFTYFNNFYKNFLSTQTALDRLGVPITLPNGTLPNGTPRPRIPVFQTANIARARIQGFEAEVEAPIKISVGYLTPNGNFSYLRGDNLTDNTPLNTISPFRTNAGVRWQNFAKNYFADYTARIVGKQTRLSPVFRQSNRGDEPGFVTHNLSGGYYFRRERFNFNVNVGVSNLFNRFYSEQYVLAPARGRSFTIGTSWEIK
jgi:outer membrane receptor protein involved in Fe transport